MYIHRCSVICDAFILSVIFFCSLLHARIISDFSYSSLLSKSDLVVIGEVLSTSDTAEVLVLSNMWPRVEFRGMNTIVRPLAILKGSYTDASLTFFHYRTDRVKQSMHGRPLFVRFWGQKQSEKSPAEYVFFLRHRDDGRYEAVTGQIDSLLSVRQLYHFMTLDEEMQGMRCKPPKEMETRGRERKGEASGSGGVVGRPQHSTLSFAAHQHPPSTNEICRLRGGENTSTNHPATEGSKN